MKALSVYLFRQIILVAVFLFMPPVEGHKSCRNMSVVSAQ